MPTYAVGRSTYDERQGEIDARHDRYTALLAEAINGKGAFWDLSSAGYDAEQQYAAFRILQLAYQLPGASGAERWRVVDAALLKLFDHYAQSESL